MAVEFFRTINQAECNSFFLNLTDDRDRTYGRELALPHKKELLAVDGQGRQTTVNMHWKNQIWGKRNARGRNIRTWFEENRIQPGDVVNIRFDSSERENGLPVLHLARTGDGHPPPSVAEASQQERSVSEGPAEIPLGFEKQIEDFLVPNVGLIEPGLTLYVEEGREGRQYPTDIGVIDMLCVRPNGDFVVVELKKGRASDRVVGQISRYIGWVKANLAGGREVFGLILAVDGDEAMRYAVAAHPNLRARYMVIKLELTDEPPK